MARSVSPELDHPDDRVQRVVEEMGIDLRLEGAQLQLPLELLLPAVLLDEVADLLHRDVAVPGELVHLVARVDGDVDVEVAALHGLHRAPQALDRPGDVGRDGHPGGDRAHQDEQREHEEDVLRLPAGAEQLVQVGDGHDVPARLLRAHHRVQDGPAVHHGVEVPAVQGHDLGDPLRLEVPVDELLPGVIHDVPVAAEDEHVPGGSELDVLAQARDDLVVEVHLDEPGALLAGSDRQGADEGDHPGIAIVHEVLHVGGGHRRPVRDDPRLQLRETAGGGPPWGSAPRRWSRQWHARPG